VIVWLPALDKAVVVKLAVPLLTGAVLSGVDPSEKVTVPPAPGISPEIVAVKVTL
jgi:hypothetical protein